MLITDGRKLCTAARFGRTEELSDILENGERLNDNFMSQALILSAEGGEKTLPCLDLLVKHGAPLPEHQDSLDYVVRVIFLAAKAGFPSCKKFTDEILS
jgi:hypothetical protein